MNKYCGRYLRDRHLHHYSIYGESVQDRFEHNRRLRNPSTTAVQQAAIHGSHTVSMANLTCGASCLRCLTWNRSSQKLYEDVLYLCEC
jgi:hypothetical protein